MNTSIRDLIYDILFAIELFPRF